MRALILAGGLGTRLRPLTHTRPKHLLPIANVPHIEHVLGLLRTHGVSESVLLTSYLAAAFEPTIETARGHGSTLQVAHEREPLGTAGALKNGAELVGDETFLAFNGDILTDVDLGELVRFHRERDAEATIFLTPVADPSAFGVVPADPQGRVLGFIEKPPPGEAPTNLINAGVYVLEPSILDRIPKDEVYSAERQLFPQLVDEGAGLFATTSRSYWRDIGTPDSLLNANLDALTGAYAASGSDAVAVGKIVDETARVAEDARLSRVAVGAGCVVEGGAIITDSVLLPDVRVERGAVIERSILGEGVRVAAGAKTVGETVGDGEEVPS